MEIKSLKAPERLAMRPSGNNKRQRYVKLFMCDRDRILYSISTVMIGFANPYNVSNIKAVVNYDGK